MERRSSKNFDCIGDLLATLQVFSMLTAGDALRLGNNTSKTTDGMTLFSGTARSMGP